MREQRVEADEGSLIDRRTSKVDNAGNSTHDYFGPVLSSCRFDRLEKDDLAVKSIPELSLRLCNTK